MLTLAKTVKEWVKSYYGTFDLQFKQDYVRFLDDGSIVTFFDGEQSELIGFDSQAILSFIDKVENAYKGFNVVENWQTIFECMSIVESFDKNKATLFSFLVSNYQHKELSSLASFCKNDARLFVGSASDYACEYVQDCYNIDEKLGNLACYFDYDKFGRDLLLNGDIIEVSPYVILTNPSEFR